MPPGIKQVILANVKLHGCILTFCKAVQQQIW